MKVEKILERVLVKKTSDLEKLIHQAYDFTVKAIELVPDEEIEEYISSGKVFWSIDASFPCINYNYYQMADFPIGADGLVLPPIEYFVSENQKTFNALITLSCDEEERKISIRMEYSDEISDFLLNMIKCEKDIIYMGFSLLDNDFGEFFIAFERWGKDATANLVPVLGDYITRRENDIISIKKEYFDNN